MPALALRDQPLDCSMRLRDLPAWPPPPPPPARDHGACPACVCAASDRRLSPAR
ncbi:hypothetical protein JYU34_008370 [Plutella xylostella]|uniref:Uncharacterized protein n=1 Tax=Plutella xylostella TaxID=51655 RepID=A0ABQ7QKT0_PLUXY|nr:hypothetical protein JYU34_008370 [Plutella xylostella]